MPQEDDTKKDKGSAVAGFFADDPQGWPPTKGNAMTDAAEANKERSRQIARRWAADAAERKKPAGMFGTKR
jgi:hypothetical protein